MSTEAFAGDVVIDTDRTCRARPLTSDGLVVLAKSNVLRGTFCDTNVIDGVTVVYLGCAPARRLCAQN